MQDAPYVLESLIDNWEDEHSAEVTQAFTFFLMLLNFWHHYLGFPRLSVGYHMNFFCVLVLEALEGTNINLLVELNKIGL